VWGKVSSKPNQNYGASVRAYTRIREEYVAAKREAGKTVRTAYRGSIRIECTPHFAGKVIVEPKVTVRIGEMCFSYLDCSRH
jgi:hypothetical protein